MADKRNQIAIIDDEPDIAELFSEGLKMVGYKTVTFEDVEGAIEYISLNRSYIALVTVDWRMPLMDGFRIIKLISDIDSDIKFILISGYDLPERQLRPNRNISYLKKPIRIAELIETVNKVLDSNKINIPNK
jgi:DNA-binding NtrC family response regulator